MKLPVVGLFLMTVLFSSFTPAHADTNSAAVYLTCLINFETYAESIWHDATNANNPPDSGYFGDGASGGNGGIRGSCGVAVAYAVMAQALPADARRASRIARIRKAINYAANTHVSGTNVCIDGLKWGHDWQTAMWAAHMGFACQLVQNDLPAATVTACQRAVADEATYRAAIAPASGYVGDTKAEENAWDSNILALGAAWLSGNPNASTWLTGAKKYLANTYTVANTNGDPLAAWINTVTLYPDFELQNHGFYYPVYQMVAGMSLGDSMLMARLANPSVASQLQPFAEHNVLPVWNSLSLVQLDGGDFAYPASLDWTLHDYEQNSYMAWVASHFNDPLARWADAQLVRSVRYRQQLNGDGRFIGPSETDVYFYREAVEAYRTAVAYLQHVNADYTNGPMTAPGGYAPQLFADVGLIEQRGAAGYISLSFYGSQVMGIIAPPAVSIPTHCYLVTPRLPGVIGLGALGNPTGAQLVSFETNANGFDAELQVQNGTQGTTEVYIKSTGESVGIVEVPWPAAGVTGTTAGSFTVGIENQPLTGGTRLLEWNGGSRTITNRSGVSQNISSQWLCVAGEYGMIAGPAGYFSYQAASSYNILGAAQDTLQFMTSQPLGPRYCIWLPGKNATVTQTNAGGVTWAVSGTNATLTFPGTNGNYQISAALPPPVTNAYVPYQLPIATITASSSQASYPPAFAVDGDATTFWVSSGTAAGQGPTANHPEWLLVNFPRQVAISEFKIAPRTFNGGYGPKAVQMLLNG
ncbi:MAG: Coagulation factor 5/8 type domain protein, partial [Pedosphaera sp.]|nr:Coagulation factor 5/8 type domain protein [Pedosphaera sp.]